MARNYTVQTRVLRPVADVFDAVYSSDKLCSYFTDKATSDLSEGATVGWHWSHYHATLQVTVDRVIRNERIELRLDSKVWGKTSEDSYDVRVVFEFEQLEDGSTLLSISEEGWKTDAEGLKGSHDNCGGWSQMGMCLKAWLEYGIALR